MSAIKVKRVLRFDEIQRHFRLFRVLWQRGTVGDGSGYSVKLSFALTPKLFLWHRDARTDRLCVFLGIRVHYVRSYGGIMV